MEKMYPKQEVISQAQLRARLDELAQQITRDYGEDCKLLLIGVLNGAFIFTADLCRLLPMPVEIDFIKVSSYGASTESAGSIQLVKPPGLDLRDKNILLIEDIVDTGITMSWLLDHFRRGPARSVKVCSLIDKKERRQVVVDVDYVGFDIAKGFLVGYGLDCAEQYRNLPAVYSLEG